MSSVRSRSRGGHQAARRPAAAGPARTARRPLAIHFDNSRDHASVFWNTPERYRDAEGRHPRLARRLNATIGWDRASLDAALPTTEILVAWDFDRRDLATRAPRLKWIHLIGAGIEHVLPLDWVPPGCVVTNNSGVHAPKAGEFAAMALLALNNRWPAHLTNQRSATWRQVFNDPITGKTVVIIGVGAMGGAAAQRARAMKMNVLGVRRSGRPHRHVDEMFRPDDLERVLPRADFVLVTVPLTPATRGLLGRKQLDMLRPEAGVINMGRAGVIDYEALVEKLTRGELSGAVLDVFDPEPLPAASSLWHTPNLIMTPHVSSDSLDYSARTLDLIFENVQRYLVGRRLVNEVNLALGY